MKPPSALLHRTANLEEVRAPQREIVMRATAYNTFSTVSDGRGAYEEAFAPGAFADSIAKRGDRVRVLRDHKPERVVGRPIEYADTATSLIVRAKIAETHLGDETLTLAADGLIAPSVGFTDSLGYGAKGQRLRRSVALLHEISLVPFQGRDDAGIIAIRDEDLVIDTPLLDEVRAWMAVHSA